MYRILDILADVRFRIRMLICSTYIDCTMYMYKMRYSHNRFGDRSSKCGILCIGHIHSRDRLSFWLFKGRFFCLPRSLWKEEVWGGPWSPIKQKKKGSEKGAKPHPQIRGYSTVAVDLKGVAPCRKAAREGDFSS